MTLDILNRIFFGNTLGQYVVVLGAIGIGLAVVLIGGRLVMVRFERLATKTSTTLDDFSILLVKRIGIPILAVGVVYWAINCLTLSSQVAKILYGLLMAASSWFGARLFHLLLNYGLQRYVNEWRNDVTLARSLDALMSVAKFVIWSVAIVIFLDNIGYNVSTMLAGLGIGGVAIAIAAQALLKDFFSFFSIVFDRPFNIGDFIAVGDLMGTVEYIGIKTTRLRSLSGEQLIFSNTDLTNSRVRNYQLMEKRRVAFHLGVIYQTPLNQLKAIPTMIETVIRATPNTEFDRAHFFNYGDFSLNFEVVYYIIGADYNTYMDIHQSINLDIYGAFSEAGIEFAYPTQTIVMSRP